MFRRSEKRPARGDVAEEAYLICGCLCGVTMSLFFSHTMSGTGFPMAFTANATRVPCLTVMFFSFSTKQGRVELSWAAGGEVANGQRGKRGDKGEGRGGRLPSTVRVTVMVVRPARL